MVEQALDNLDQAGSGNKDKLILLLLRKDFLKSYMGTLVDRLLESDVRVAVEKTKYPEEKQKKFRWILNFPGDLPLGKAPDFGSLDLIFRVPGREEIQLDKQLSIDSKKLTKLMGRYKEVQQRCKDREKNSFFVKLAVTDAVLRRELQMMRKFEDLVSRL